MEIGADNGTQVESSSLLKCTALVSTVLPERISLPTLTILALIIRAEF